MNDDEDLQRLSEDIRQGIIFLSIIWGKTIESDI